MTSFQPVWPQPVQRGFPTAHAADTIPRQRAHEVARNIHTCFGHRLGRVVGRAEECSWGLRDYEWAMLHEELAQTSGVQGCIGHQPPWRRDESDGKTGSSGIEGPLWSS